MLIGNFLTEVTFLSHMSTFSRNFNYTGSVENKSKNFRQSWSYYLGTLQYVCTNPIQTDDQKKRKKLDLEVKK